MNPAKVIGQLEISLKDLPTANKLEWHNSIQKMDVFYLIQFNKDEQDKKQEAGDFAIKNGISLVRGCFVTGEKGKPILTPVVGGDDTADTFTIQILFDPVQYREDMESLVTRKAKFLEEIYSDCQVVVRASRHQDLRTLHILRGISEFDYTMPSWLRSQFLG